MNKTTIETDYWALLCILFGALGFVVAYLYDALIQFGSARAQNDYLFWVQEQSLHNLSTYFLVAAFFAVFGLFLLYMFVTDKT